MFLRICATSPPSAPMAVHFNNQMLVSAVALWTLKWRKATL